MSKLIIVESPAKCATIKKILGKDFSVYSTYGHIRQLPKDLSKAVDVKGDFSLSFTCNDKQQQRINAIKQQIKRCHTIYLAADNDREGEGICWHLAQVYSTELKNKEVHRIVFNSITKEAILSGIEHCRQIDSLLANAYQARLALDFLVGFKLSPVLRKTIRPKLSAGRVQSPTLKIVKERDQQIAEFIPEEYFTLDISSKSHRLTLLKINHTDCQQKIASKKQALEIQQRILAAPQCSIVKVSSTERTIQPPKPFITASLQQAATSKLSMRLSKLTSILQHLYENSYITYIRTDSVNLAPEALVQLAGFITQHFGAQQVNLRSAAKRKSSEEAHEAIRPVNINQTPEVVATKLSVPQLKVYTLIWQQTVASHMVAYKVNTTLFFAENSTKEFVFKLSDSFITTHGWNKIIPSSISLTPQLSLPLNSTIVIDKVEVNRKVSQAPAKINEGSLVKKMQELKIGRPSTYAPTISTLIARKYLTVDNNQLSISEVGIKVVDFLDKYFGQYIDYNFTAKLEVELDNIAKGKTSYIKLMKKFFTGLEKSLHQADKVVNVCPQCSSGKIVAKFGKYGAFYGCSNYPECNYIVGAADKASKLALANELDQVSCFNCDSGLFVARRNNRGALFYACNNYPECKTAISYKPIKGNCECGSKVLLATKDSTQYKCCKCNKITQP